MARQLSPQLIAAKKRLEKERTKLLTIAAEEAVQFFQDNFQRGGFLDTRVKKWAPRKKEDKTFKAKGTKRGVLIGPGGGSLWRSISRTSLNSKRAIIGIRGADVSKYASVHNFGLRSGRPSPGSFIMPKRQFMGESKTLNKKILRLIKRRVKKIL